MKDYGKHYIVYVQESIHNYFKLCPENKLRIYGIYESLSKARKALKDYASICEADYHTYGKTAYSRIVNELDTIVIMKDWIVNQHDGELMRCPGLITIRIEREL